MVNQRGGASFEMAGVMRQVNLPRLGRQADATCASGVPSPGLFGLSNPRDFFRPLPMVGLPRPDVGSGYPRNIRER